jgi:hypothetical protein
MRGTRERPRAALGNSRALSLALNHSVSFIAERVSWIVNDSTTNE